MFLSKANLEHVPLRAQQSHHKDIAESLQISALLKCQRKHLRASGKKSYQPTDSFSVERVLLFTPPQPSQAPKLFTQNSIRHSELPSGLGMTLQLAGHALGWH